MPTIQTSSVRAGLAGAKPAPLFRRLMALVLDCLLAGLVAFIIVTRVVLPDNHPNAQATMETEVKAMNAEFEKAQKTNNYWPQYTPSDEAAAIVADISSTFYLTFLAYFIASEVTLGGGTLGKRVVGLRAARWDSGAPPGLIEILLRCLIKVTCLLFIFPLSFFFLLLDALPALVRPGRRAGHDLFSRTMVTGDAPPPPPPDEYGHDDMD